MSEPTKGPWQAVETGHVKGLPGPAYISIIGPNGEKICDIFPHAGKGGAGLDAARANARLIVQARSSRP